MNEALYVTKIYDFNNVENKRQGILYAHNAILELKIISSAQQVNTSCRSL